MPNIISVRKWRRKILDSKDNSIENKILENEELFQDVTRLLINFQRQENQEKIPCGKGKENRFALEFGRGRLLFFKL